MQISENAIGSRTISEAIYQTRMRKADSPAEFESIIRIARSDLRYTDTAVNAEDKKEENKTVINRVISESEIRKNHLKIQQTSEKTKNILAKPESAVAAVMSITGTEVSSMVGITAKSEGNEQAVDIRL